MRSTLKNEISFSTIKIIFLTLPIYHISFFFLNYFSIFTRMIGSYIYLIVLLILSFISFRDNRNTLTFSILWIFFIIYTFGFDGDLNSKARSNVTFINTCASLVFFSTFSPNLAEILRYDKFFLRFSYIYMIIYFITVPIAGLRIEFDYLGNERIYYYGFIIGHAYGYYAIILSYYLLHRFHYLWSFPIILSTYFSGARSVLVILLYTISIYTINHIKIHFITVKKLILIMMVIIITLIAAVKYIKPFSFVYESTLQILQKGTDIFSDSEGVRLTAGRTYIIKMGFNEISTFNFKEILFGRGPLSAEKYLSSFTSLGWFHNDFLQIFYCYGTIGVILLIYSLTTFVIQNRSYFIIGIFFIASFTNGFYLYDPTQIIIILVLVNLINKYYQMAIRNDVISPHASI